MSPDVINFLARGAMFIAGLAVAAALYRIIQGPTVADRVAGADLLSSSIMAIAILAGIVLQTHAYVDVVMAMAILGFFATVAFAKYILGGRPIDH